MSLPFLSWAHELSQYYKLPLSEVRALLKLGILPQESFRDLDKALWQDEAAIAKLEAIRPRFDTDVNLLLGDLRSAGAALFGGVPEKPHAEALVEYRCYSFGAIDRAYPITRHGMPWKRHRVGITRAELAAAGYTEFKTLWSQTEPFACVPIGGEIPLGPFGWVYSGSGRRNLCVPRGQFLQRLANVLEVTR